MSVAKLHSLDVIPTKGLREIFAGKWEGMLFDELCVKYEAEYTVWRKDIGRACCTDGESVKELSDRVLATLADIARENDGKTVCIATHATPIRAVCAAAAGLAAEDMARIPWVSNASCSVFDYENGKFDAVYIDRSDYLGDLTTNLPANV
jgi:probable phosphoglycerate mutase